MSSPTLVRKRELCVSLCRFEESQCAGLDVSERELEQRDVERRRSSLLLVIEKRTETKGKG